MSAILGTVALVTQMVSVDRSCDEAREHPWQSRAAADVVFATVPPYMAMGWMSMGVLLLSELLEREGITSRIVRFGDVPDDAPQDILDLQDATLWGDPTLEERLRRVGEAAERNSEFFELVLGRLLAGPERVFGFSIWRLNVDVALEVARRLKQRRPEALIIFGGPETGEAPDDLKQHWIDIVVKGSAEGVAVPVVQACLSGSPAAAAIWDNVWVNPRHGTSHGERMHAEAPPIPRMDYSRVVPLQVGAPHPSFPVLMNMGCPFRCGFCTNTTIYPEISWGSPERVVDEMVEIMHVWLSLHPPGAAPPLDLTICDAALNANPRQYEALCRAIIAADWPARPASIVTQILIDTRMTRERAQLTMDAGLDHSFFGLESANPRIRRQMKKPGKKEEIAAALQVCADVGWMRGLNCGIIVGWPDETEQEFLETVEFLEWMLSLGVMRALNVIPMYRTPGMMDHSLLRDAEGPTKGVAWRMPTAGGDPAIRARRYFHIFEHFAGVMHVNSPVPHRVAADLMLSETSRPFWAQWIRHHGEHPVDLLGKDFPEPAPESEMYMGARQPEQSVANEPVFDPPGENAVEQHVHNDAQSAGQPGIAENGNEGQENIAPVDGSGEISADASERLLVGRGASVVLRLSPAPGAEALARARSHGLSYLGTSLPGPLHDIVLQLGLAVADLPDESVAVDVLWADIADIVARIAPDVSIGQVAQ